MIDKKKRRFRRPVTYNKEIAAKICREIISGKSLIAITKPPIDDDMPTDATVYNWMSRHKEFAELYAKAKEYQADAFAEQMIDIADEASNDGEGVNKAKLRIETRKWLAERLKADKYGNKGVTVNNLTQINNSHETYVLKGYNKELEE